MARLVSPVAMVGQGSPVAMVGQGSPVAMAGQGSLAAMADPGSWAAMADPGIRDTRCKSSQHMQIKKCAANPHNTCKLRNALQILTTHAN